MPSRVKLLDTQAAGVTGASLKIGMGQAPYVIRVDGGFTLGGGSAGTNGVIIETSPDDGTTWDVDFGDFGGTGTTSETEERTLQDLPSGTIAFIRHYAKHIRARTGANMVGTATVRLEMGR